MWIVTLAVWGALVGTFSPAPARAADAENVASDARIEVKPVAEVGGTAGASSSITLADIVVTHGVPAATLEKLREVSVADLPQPGETRSFSGAMLRDLFRPVLSDLEMQSSAHVQLRIPARVSVTRKTFRLTSFEVEKEFKAQLSNLCADCQFDFTALQLPVVPTNIPAGATWQLRAPREIPHGGFSVPLEVVNEDGSKRTYWLSGTLAVTKKVPVASRAIAIGEHLHEEDYIVESRDVTFATDAAPSGEEFKASVSSRSIAAGQIIWRSALRREQAVKAGDIVKVVAGSDDWQVMIDGVAQSSGYIGDSVNVKIPRTQKMISGSLTEKGVVVVR